MILLDSNLDLIFQAMQLRHQNAIANMSPLPVVVYDNDPRKLPGDGIRCRLKIEFVSRRRVSIGRETARRRLEGEIVGEWYDDLDTGPARLYDAASFVEDGFRSAPILQGIHYRAVVWDYLGEFDGSQRMQVRVPFYVDEHL
jgi:hypothetical protein